MIFGLLPNAVEIIVVTLILGFVMIKVTSKAQHAANGNLKQELRPSQKAIYGPVWLLAALLFAACIVTTCSATSELVAIFYGYSTLALIAVTGVRLSIAWPFPRMY